MKWFDRYESQSIKGLHTTAGKGRPAIVRLDNEAEIAKIEELFEQNPQNLNTVLAGIEKEPGKKMSKRTLHRLLKIKTGAGSGFVR